MSPLKEHRQRKGLPADRRGGLRLARHRLGPREKTFETACYLRVTFAMTAMSAISVLDLLTFSLFLNAQLLI